MPYKARPCPVPGCPGILRGDVCTLGHPRPQRDPPPRPREAVPQPSAAKRGYDRKWRAYRAAFLQLHPLCVSCGRQAVIVDHIQKISGANDPLFWEPSNHQPLCRTCHNRKIGSQDGGFGNPVRKE